MARRAHKKSRGGCFECKRRHIKVSSQFHVICGEKTLTNNSAAKTGRYAHTAFLSGDFAGMQDSELYPPSKERVAAHLPPSRNRQHRACPWTRLRLFQRSQTRPPPCYMRNCFTISQSRPCLLYMTAGVTFLYPSSADKLRPGHPLPLQRAPSSSRIAPRDPAQIPTRHLQAPFSPIAESRPPITTRVSVRVRSRWRNTFFAGLPLLIYPEPSLTMRHVSIPQPSLPNFLDRFIHYLRLHRGVRTIVGGNWSHLKQTSLKPVLEECSNNIRDGAIQVYSRLSQLIQAAKLGDTFTKTYVEVINALQRAMNAVQSPLLACGCA